MPDAESSRGRAKTIDRACAPPHIEAMTTDPHASLRDAVFRTVMDGVGESDVSVRRAAADGTGVPAELQPLIDKIHAHAYRVTDNDIAQLRSNYGDDRLFEIIVAAALGASRQRLFAGLKALDDA